MKLCELIKQRREQAGMSLQDMADACGATKTHVWDVEQGKTVNVGLLFAVRLSVALGIPVNVLAASALESGSKKPTGPTEPPRPLEHKPFA